MAYLIKERGPYIAPQRKKQCRYKYTGEVYSRYIWDSGSKEAPVIYSLKDFIAIIYRDRHEINKGGWEF